MSNITQNITFVNSGLDSDSDLSYIASGDSLGDRNILINEDGLNGLKTNIKGNESININAYPDYVGSCFDPNTRYAYWIGHNSVGNTNGIAKYNVDTLIGAIIFEDVSNYFGIDPNYKMKDVKILNNKLYFTPRISEPKVIDLTMAYNYYTYTDWTGTSGYAINTTKRFCGGLFKSNAATSAGESPVTTPLKWDRIGDCYDNTNGEFSTAFNVIKTCPTEPLTCIYGTNSSRDINFVRSKAFRFAYRYRYFDETYSFYSSYSEMALPLFSERFNGEPFTFDRVYDNNKITLTVNAGSSSLVKDIEIVFQEINGDWKQIPVINRRALSVLTEECISFDFYNDCTYEPAVNDELNVIYDAVPRTASCQEIINKNILCYGYVKEGFDNLEKADIDITLTPHVHEIINHYDGTTKRDTSSDVTYTDGLGGATHVALNSWWPGSGIVAGNIVHIIIGGYNILYRLVSADLTTLSTFKTSWGAIIEQSSPFAVSSSATGIDITHIGHVAPIVTLYTISASSNVDIKPIDKVPGFKTGATHPFCIFYYDEAMRRGDAQVSSDMSIYIPTLNDTAGVTTTSNRYGIDWSVNHTAPEWAKYWRWGYAGNRTCDYFVQYNCFNVISGGEDLTEIDISPLQNIKITNPHLWKTYLNSIIDPYIWEKGDRVRLITGQIRGSTNSIVSITQGSLIGSNVLVTTTTAHGLISGDVIKIVENSTYNGIYSIAYKTETSFEIWATYSGATVTGGYYTSGFVGNSGDGLCDILDFEIANISDDSSKIYINADFTNINDYIYQIIEIYRPTKESANIIYYEIGDLMPVINNAGILYHGGITQDQTASLPATGSFFRGDVYHIQRYSSYPLGLNNIETTLPEGSPIYMESDWYSDFYISDDWDRGKIGVESSIGEKNLNIIRCSNAYLQNTKLNGLSTFEALNYKEVSDIYGNITSIIENGDTLKVYMGIKSASIGIGLKEWVDANGNVTTSATSDVLGYVRYSPQKYGSIFPESITVNNRFVYGFDIYTGTLWRDSANGIFPISGRYESIDGSGSYLMETYFKTKAKALLESGISNVSVQTVWDDEYKLLYVLFYDSITSSNNEVLAFHEPSNRWVSFYDFKIPTVDVGVYDFPCWVQSIGNVGFLSFGEDATGESVWRHNSNDVDRCNFYGVQQPCVVSMVANKNGGVMKTLDSITIHSTGEWSGTVTIPASLSYPNGMYSILPSAKFKKREGKLMSEFMRNGKTTSNTVKVLEYINGEPLRGYAADIRLTNTDLDKVSMLMVDVNMTKSDV